MIHIVTDSTVSLPAGARARWPFHSVPLKLCFDERAYDEDNGLSREEFYQLLASARTAPTTTQPAPGEFTRLYERLLQDAGDEIVSVHISGGLSGTVDNARVAAGQVAAGRISVVDSKSTTTGLGIMLLAALEAREQGKSRAEIVGIVERMAREYQAVFMVDDLEYLRKGGRINNAARLMGTLLNIKPVLHMVDGKIEALDKPRTRKRGVQRLLDEIDKCLGPGPMRAGVGHVQAPGEAAEFAQMVQERFQVIDLFVSEISPVISSHLGPGTLAICACRVGEDEF